MQKKFDYSVAKDLFGGDLIVMIWRLDTVYVLYHVYNWKLHFETSPASLALNHNK
jgi:hypothetical protein